jgi:hypothetical protein
MFLDDLFVGMEDNEDVNIVGYDQEDQKFRNQEEVEYVL